MDITRRAFIQGLVASTAVVAAGVPVPQRLHGELFTWEGVRFRDDQVLSREVFIENLVEARRQLIRNKVQPTRDGYYVLMTPPQGF